MNASSDEPREENFTDLGACAGCVWALLFVLAALGVAAAIVLLTPGWGW